MHTDVVGLNERVREESAFVDEILAEMGKVIVGQKPLVERLLIGLLGNGHILIEGVPGLAKTLAVRTLGRCIDATFHRIQFIPDLLPADVVGTMIYNPRDGLFTTRKGPIFANLILADEVNRAPAKVQSALLEAMQEHQVTIGDSTYPLEDPFLVMATQNPIEQEGTYPLPEAQVDRFMMKLIVGYPSREEERLIMDRMADGAEIPVRTVAKPDDIRRARSVVSQVYVDEKIKEYIVRLVHATRDPRSFGLDLAPFIAYGASPRASLCLYICARAHAFVRRRGYATPEDVKAIAMDVLRHRVIVTYEAEAENVTSETVARQILDRVEVP